jgi:hypothetical protein
MNGMDQRTNGRICKPWRQERPLGKRRYAQQTSQEPAPASFVERVPEAGSCSSVGERAVAALASPPGCFTPSPFPGGSHLLAASRPGPSLPPPPGKPRAGSCWPSTTMMVHVSRDACTCGIPSDGKPPLLLPGGRVHSLRQPTISPASSLFPFSVQVLPIVVPRAPATLGVCADGTSRARRTSPSFPCTDRDGPQNR